MTTQKFALASLAGGVTLFILGGLVYGWLLAGFFEASPMGGSMKAEPDWLYLALSELMFAVLLTTVIGKWAGVSGAGDGFKIGAVFALLLGVSMSLGFLGVTNLTTPMVATVDTIVGTIRFGIGGAVIGIVLGRS